MNDDNIKNNIGQIIMGLATMFDAQDREMYDDIIRKLKDQYEHNPGIYDSEISIARIRFFQYAALPFKEAYEFKENDNKKIAIIEHIYDGLLEHYLRVCIEKNEGTVYSSDKVRFIIGQIKKSLIDGKVYSLYQEYTKEDGMDKYIGQQCFWSPKQFSDTEQVIKSFWEWYNMV